MSDQSVRTERRGAGGEAASNGRSPARTFLQPIAAPSIVGLFGFAVSTFMVAANLAGWYGSSSEPVFLFPLAFAFGGIAQFAAGMWSFKARDAVAAGIHSTWGAFWIGYGILWYMVARGMVSTGRAFDLGLGYWFIGLTAVTFMGAIIIGTDNIALAFVLHTLWLGAGALAVGLLTATHFWVVIAGYLLILSAIAAWYSGSALMAAGMGKPMFPMGLSRREREKAEFSAGFGEPGVKRGQ
ncbi:MAG: GPR1/FUN34/YaaH family transporter [Rubrobacteraceae bacterium]|uniref:acetate uptake transporter family protein n=1 Tax=Rubrobacter naiadicus TaxID=1392641 RepID=UPI0023620ECA|nr:GPR1/FUN34/YaaH family transporter [Rubrobacter naiadicus]MBX6763825.1 hypothetical protein [Rubrobacteraceae bacterium]MCL6437815.1 GPR1/FUN34/YaaH family transporter [Rubrobacteraceae bacterium]